MGEGPYREVSNHVPQLGGLAALCWCESYTVHVPAELIKQLRTLSCGQPQCNHLQAVNERKLRHAEDKSSVAMSSLQVDTSASYPRSRYRMRQTALYEDGLSPDRRRPH